MSNFVVFRHTLTSEWGVFDSSGLLIVPVFRYLALLKRKGYSPNTIKGYAEDLRDLYMFMHSRGLIFSEMENKHIQDFQTWEFQPKNERASPQLYLGKTSAISNSTWNRKVAAINSFMSWHEMNSIPLKLKSICGARNTSNRYGYQKKISTWSVKEWKKHPEYISLTQRVQIRNSLNSRDQLIFDLFYFSGLRISELFSLTIDSIPAVESSPIIPIQLEDNRTRDRLKGRTKTGSRVFYIPFGLYVSLRHYIKPLQKQGSIGRGRGIKHRILFTTIRNGGSSKKGGSLSQDTFRSNLKAACIRANVYTIRNEENTHFVPHDLRHTFATDLLRLTNDLTLVKDVLGHQSIITTQRYTHTSDEEIASSLSDVFSDLYSTMLKEY